MSRGGVSYHERQLTPEERALIAQQQRYLASIQPSIDKLVNRGTALLDDVVNPEWNSLYTTTVHDIDNLRKEQARLATGQLPQAYSDAKMNYFNRIYERTMGKNLAKMAKSGIVDSSRLNHATNDMQRNMAEQMSKDYTNDIGMQSKLLDQKYNFALSPLEVAHKANTYSFANPAQHLALAQGQSRSTNEALKTQGELNNGRTTVTQKGPGFWGGFLSAGANFLGGLACFPKGTMIALEDGEKPIEAVEIGDEVINDQFSNTVKAVLYMGKHELFRFVTKNHELITTRTQPIMTQYGFHKAGLVDKESLILTDTGYEEVLSRERLGKEDVYELYVNGDHTFYANGVMVEGITDEEYEDMMNYGFYVDMLTEEE